MELEIQVFEFWWKKNSYLLKANIEADKMIPETYNELNVILDYIESLRDPITFALIVDETVQNSVWFINKIMKKLEEKEPQNESNG